MLKIHFSCLKKKEKKLCHPIHYTTTRMLNYPHPTINLPALEQVFLFLKKRITETSLALWLFFLSQQNEFSGVQEGKCNYGFSANVHGPSWFLSG